MTAVKVVKKSGHSEQRATSIFDNRGFLDRKERPALLVMSIDVEFAAVEVGNCDLHEQPSLGLVSPSHP